MRMILKPYIYTNLKKFGNAYLPKSYQKQFTKKQLERHLTYKLGYSIAVAEHEAVDTLNNLKTTTEIDWVAEVKK